MCQNFWQHLTRSNKRIRAIVGFQLSGEQIDTKTIINAVSICSFCWHCFFFGNVAVNCLIVFHRINEMWILWLQTWELYERKELVGLVDESLNGAFDAEEACRFLKIGLLCTQDTPKLRPSMSSVVKMLIGEMDVDSRAITKPGLISDFMDLKIRSEPKPVPDAKNVSDNLSSGSDIQDSSTMSSGITFTAVYDRSIWTFIDSI